MSYKKWGDLVKKYMVVIGWQCKIYTEKKENQTLYEDRNQITLH
jgi:hypothetical protein